MEVHERLRFNEDGYPAMYIFSTCKNWIRTVPNLPYDETKTEDAKTPAQFTLTGDDLDQVEITGGNIVSKTDDEIVFQTAITDIAPLREQLLAVKKAI